MRNKLSKIKYLLITLSALSLSMFVGCSKALEQPQNSSSESQESSNIEEPIKIVEFDVPENAAVEINEYYEFPFIMAVGSNNENYKPNIRVYHGDEDKTSLIEASIRNKIKITKPGIWRVDYTITIGGETITKSTNITAGDNKAPSIIISDYDSMNEINTEVTLPKIDVVDNSGSQITPVIEKVVLNGKEINNAIVDNKLVLDNHGKYMILVSATDNSQNKSTENIVYYVPDYRDRFGIVEDFELLLPSENDIFTDKGTYLTIDDKDPTNCRLRWMGEGLWPSLYFSKNYIEKIADRYDTLAIDVMLDNYDGAEKTDVYFMFDGEVYGDYKHIGANEKITMRISSQDLKKLIAKMPSEKEQDEKLKNTIKIGINNKSSSQMVNVYLDNIRGEYVRRDVIEAGGKYGFNEDGVINIVESEKMNNVLNLFDLKLNKVLFDGKEVTNGVNKDGCGYIAFNNKHENGIYTIVYDALPKDTQTQREGKISFEIKYNAPSNKIGFIEDFENLNLEKETHIRKGENGVTISIKEENGNKKISAIRNESDWVSLFIENGYFNKVNYDIYDYLTFEFTNKAPKDCYCFVRSPNVLNSINGILIKANTTITISLPVSEVESHFNQNGYMEIHLWSNNIEEKEFEIDNIKFENKNKQVYDNETSVDLKTNAKNYFDILDGNNIGYVVEVINSKTGKSIEVVNDKFNIVSGQIYNITITPNANELYTFAPYTFNLKVLKEGVIADFNEGEHEHFVANSNEIVTVKEGKLNVYKESAEEAVLKVESKAFDNINLDELAKFRFTITNKSADGGTLIVRLNGSIYEQWLNKETKTIEIDGKLLKQKLIANPGRALEIVFYKGSKIEISLDLDDFETVKKSFEANFAALSDETISIKDKVVNISHLNKGEAVLVVKRAFFEDIDLDSLGKFTFKVTNNSAQAGTLFVRLNGNLYEHWLNKETILVEIKGSDLKNKLNENPGKDLEIVFYHGENIAINLDIFNFTFEKIDKFTHFSSLSGILTKEENLVNIKAGGKEEVVLIIDREYFANVNWEKADKFIFTVNNKSADGGTLIIRLNGSIAEPWLNKETKTIEIDAKVLKEKLDSTTDKNLEIVFYHSGAIEIDLDYYGFEVKNIDIFKHFTSSGTLTKFDDYVKISSDSAGEIILIIDREYFKNVDWTKVEKFTFMVNNKSLDGGTLIIRLNGNIAEPWLNRVSMKVEIDAKALKEKLDSTTDKNLEIVFYHGSAIKMELDFSEFTFEKKNIYSEHFHALGDEKITVNGEVLNISHPSRGEVVLVIDRAYFANVDWENVTKFTFKVNNKSLDGGTLIIRSNGDITTPWLNRETKTIEIEAKVLKDKLDSTTDKNLEIVFYHGGPIEMNLDFSEFNFI